MISNRVWSSVRVAAAIAVVCLLVFVALYAHDLLAAAPSKAAAQRLSVVQVAAACLSAIAALTTAMLALARMRRPRPSFLALLVPKLLHEDRLVNRDGEMRDLVGLIGSTRVVNCHGPRGAGKSFLLEHLTDVVNGHRGAAKGQPRPGRGSVALYFDLADATGFPDIEAQICRAALGDADATWGEFTSSVQQRFGRKRVILVLDNVNSPALWSQLGRAAYEYCALRRQDRLILGSIDQVTLNNLAVAPLSIPGLDLAASGELISRRGIELDEQQLKELHSDCQGLPLYLQLLTAPDHGTQFGVGTSVLDEQLIPDLPIAGRALMAHLSLLALITRRISLTTLRRMPVADLDEQLRIACNRTLITPLANEENRSFKIHDIVRDAALRVLEEEVSEASVFLFEQAYGREQYEHAALYAMFANPGEIGPERFDTLVTDVLGRAIKERNYALLGTLHARASDQPRVLRHLSTNPKLTDLWCHARASELAGLGRYEDAEDELLGSSVNTVRWHPSAIATRQQAELRFLQADVAHLLNRYDEAAELFGELGEWATTAGRPGLHARCIWGRAHVLRHQGRDLEQALTLFGEAAQLADDSDELFAKAYSITGETGIRVALNVLRDDEETLLASLETEIAAMAAHDGYMLEVWKSQAQVAWLRGNSPEAVEIVDAAVERARALNDRLLYNLYFERAEFSRLSGDHSQAKIGYDRVLEFGVGNGDRNLVTNATLGLVLTDVAAGTWIYYDSRTTARAAVLDARSVAIQTDIQATAALADRVVGLLDGDLHEPDLRLILM